MQIFVYDFHHSIATRTPSRKVNSEKLKVDAFQQAVHACFMFQLFAAFFQKKPSVSGQVLFVVSF